MKCWLSARGNGKDDVQPWLASMKPPRLASPKLSTLVSPSPSSSGKTALTQLLLTSQYTGKAVTGAAASSGAPAAAAAPSTASPASGNTMGVAVDSDPPATLGVDMYTQEHTLGG